MTFRTAYRINDSGGVKSCVYLIWDPRECSTLKALCDLAPQLLGVLYALEEEAVFCTYPVYSKTLRARLWTTHNNELALVKSFQVLKASCGLNLRHPVKKAAF